MSLIFEQPFFTIIALMVIFEGITEIISAINIKK